MPRRQENGGEATREKEVQYMWTSSETPRHQDAKTVRGLEMAISLELSEKMRTKHLKSICAILACRVTFCWRCRGFEYHLPPFLGWLSDHVVIVCCGATVNTLGGDRNRCVARRSVIEIIWGLRKGGISSAEWHSTPLGIAVANILIELNIVVNITAETITTTVGACLEFRRKRDFFVGFWWGSTEQGLSDHLFGHLGLE